MQSEHTERRSAGAALSNVASGQAGRTRWGEFVAGVRATIPLVVGAIPFGILFGALAVAVGLTPITAGAWSALVYAGSAQFVAAGLVANGATLAVIVLTTFVVNLRHLLYSASLGQYMAGLPQWLLALLAFPLTDETYVVAIARYQQADQSPYKHWYYAGSAGIMYLNWQLCTWLGILAGQRIANPNSWGLEFAFVATFIGILVPAVRSGPMIACVVTAGVAALVFNALPHQLGLVVAALAGVVAGLLSTWWSAWQGATPEQRR